MKPMMNLNTHRVRWKIQSTATARGTARGSPSTNSIHHLHIRICISKTVSYSCGGLLSDDDHGDLESADVTLGPDPLPVLGKHNF